MGLFTDGTVSEKRYDELERKFKALEESYVRVVERDGKRIAELEYTIKQLLRINEDQRRVLAEWTATHPRF